MLYCHDSYGLGHLSRTLALSRQLRSVRPELSQLIVTGSPVAHDLVLPSDADYVKLPAVVKVGADEYRARSLALDVTEIRDLRADLVLTAARHFRPHALIVDHAPAGVNGEVVPTLRFLRRERPGVRLVLGLRDVVDDGQRVRAAWTRAGIYELLDDVYHRILVYGDPRIYDAAREYGLSRRAEAKVRYVGYIGRLANGTSAEEARRELGLPNRRLVLVTAGGGGDGSALLAVAAEAAALAREDGCVQWLLVGGPLMPPAERERVLGRLPRTPSVAFTSFLDELPRYIAAADAVVSMGGYNAVSEILSSGRPAVIVPRVAPRKEQLIRAELLRRRGLVRLLHPSDLTPRSLLAEVAHVLANPPARRRIPLNGLAGAAAELDETLADECAPARAGM